jgi:hypothetical protein
MTNTLFRACLVVFAALILAAVACGTRQSPAGRAAVKYAEPRYPSYHVYPLTAGQSASSTKATGH